MADTLIEEKAPAIPIKDVETSEKEEVDFEVISSPKVKKGTVGIPAVDVEVVKCECCKLTKECTITYIARVRERHHGYWICGLCAEVVKDEIDKSGWRIYKDEALERHASFFEEFRFPPEKPTKEPIFAVRLLIRSLESPT